MLINRAARAAHVPAAIILAAALALSGCMSSTNIDSNGDDGKTYLALALPSVMQTWSMAALDKQVQPDFYQVTSWPEMRKMFDFFRRKLGPLRTITAIKRMTWTAGVSTSAGAAFDETYRVDATFQKGKGVISVWVRRQNKTWTIRGINVASDALMT